MGEVRHSTCAACRWFKPDERPEYPANGHCERFPPQLVALVFDGGHQTSVEQHRPWMHATERCGEYAFSGRSALQQGEG